MGKRMSKAARKNRAIRIILIIVIVLTLIMAAIGILRKRVSSQVNDGIAAPLSATAARGSISTTVSGSGNLSDEDVTELKLHSGVELDEVLVEAGDTVQEGDLLATVNMSTVLSAMADIQGQLDDLDDEIGEASGDALDDTIKSTMGGRVIKIFAAEGDDVSTVMYHNGALALLSLDGYMAVDVETELLSAGDQVTVTVSDGTPLEGSVASVSGGTAMVLIPDEAPYGDTVSVTDGQGTFVGSGELYIHEPMKITGIAGTVRRVDVREGQKISKGRTLFRLTDTSFSANYNSLLQEREQLVEKLQRLIQVYHDGAVLAPISGTVSSVGAETSTQSGTGSILGDLPGTSSDDGDAEQTILSICPGTKMTLSISVDEMDILSLAVGQSAAVTVDALEDETVAGTVTQIDTTAASSGGVTVYTATITLDKTRGMLSGMSASASIVIEGVDNALLIPSDALTQTSSASYVYTGYNSDTGELTGMVEVTAGMNNGDYVEITGGLAEGDTVRYYEKEDGSFPFGDMGGGFGGGDFGGGDFGGGPGGGPRFGN